MNNINSIQLQNFANHQNWPRRSAKFFDQSSTLKLKENVPESYKGLFILTKVC